MKKQEKTPNLKLTKRTIAHLTNLEMGSIYGGGGDDEDGGISRDHCTKTGTEKETEQILQEAAKLALSKLIIVC